MENEYKNTVEDDIPQINPVFFEMYRNQQIKSLKKLIPEMMECRDKHFTRRLCITFIVIFAIMVLILNSLQIAFESPLIPLFLAIFFSIILLVISYIISSFTFTKSCYEALIIEKC